jgi:ABC-type spermidine/putrescine transport system permease subunit II
LPGKLALFSLILSPMIVPPLVTAIALFFLFAKLRLNGTIGAVVLAHTILAMPWVVVVVSATLQGFPESLERAAMSLGANRYRTFRYVTFPIIRPGILAAAILAFLTSFNEFICALFIAGSSSQTLPLKMFEGLRYELDPTVSSVSTILLVMSLLTLFAVHRLRGRAGNLRT